MEFCNTLPLQSVALPPTSVLVRFIEPFILSTNPTFTILLTIPFLGPDKLGIYVFIKLLV